VIVADDHPMFREGLVASLQRVPDVEVVGEFGDGPAALAGAIELRPDIAILDVDMPSQSGIEICRALASDAPEVRVLMLTMLDVDTTIGSALRAGARGYLLKGSDGEEITRAIATVRQGGLYLPEAVATRVPALLGRADNRAFPQLTPREHEVLELMAEGLSNGAIAGRLFLAPKTIRNLVSTVLSKIHADDRLHAMRLAKESGLGRHHVGDR
jgi:DNA-binding NarL/FixJ family response regulator